MSQRTEVLLARMTSLPIVPVIRAQAAKTALGMARALFEGGITCLEITLTVPDATRVIAELRAEYGEQALIGAGTITTVMEAEDCARAGAQFLVSPGLVDGLVQVAHSAQILAIPGALTATEVMRAVAEGADVVKIFPCSVLGGAVYIKALRGPFPHLLLRPSGGVQLDNMRSYLSAGAAILGLGGALANEDLYLNEGASRLTALAALHVQALAQP